jgi:hypothetical protein
MVSLDPQDVENLRNGITLECRLSTDDDIALRLTVQSDVQKENLEEKGFHLTLEPHNAGYDAVTAYDICITPAVLDRIIERGGVITRCRADRATISYWDPENPTIHYGG